MKISHAMAMTGSIFAMHHGAPSSIKRGHHNRTQKSLMYKRMSMYIFMVKRMATMASMISVTHMLAHFLCGIYATCCVSLYHVSACKFGYHRYPSHLLLKAIVRATRIIHTAMENLSHASIVSVWGC